MYFQNTFWDILTDFNVVTSTPTPDKDNTLCLYGEKGSWTAASIKTKKEAETGEWNLILPIINDKN